MHKYSCTEINVLIATFLRTYCYESHQRVLKSDPADSAVI